MATKNTEVGLAMGWREPSMLATFLPRCGNCEAPHPLAMKPPRPDGVCPVCSTPTAQGYTKEVPALITGKDIMALFARGFLKMGKWLIQLARRV